MAPSRDECCRKVLALALLCLLGGQEVLAVRTHVGLFGDVGGDGAAGVDKKAEAEGAASVFDGFGGAASVFEGRGGDAHEKDALGKVEALYDKLREEMANWTKSRSDEELDSGSLAEMYTNLDKSLVSSEQFAQVQEVLHEVKADLKKAVSKVENLNLFLCKRTVINSYEDTGILFQDRQLPNGYMEIRCTYKQNILNHGKVGGSVSGDDKEALEKGIDSLKGLTTTKGWTGYPLQLKLCTKSGGCGQGDEENENEGPFVPDEDHVFGGAEGAEGELTARIPIPEDLKDFLPRQEHNEDHIYAVCFDDQDDCDAMMWVPQNLHSCSGWFTAKDTRVTLGQLRDAVSSGWWSRFWKPSGKDRLVSSIGKKHQPKDLLKDEVVLDNVQAGNDQLEKRCPVKDWQKKEKEESTVSFNEILVALRSALDKKDQAWQQINQLSQNWQTEANRLAQEVAKLSRALEGTRGLANMEDVVAQVQEQYEKAVTQRQNWGNLPPAQEDLQKQLEQWRTVARGICDEVAEAGEVDACKSNQPECGTLKRECEKSGVSMEPKPCRSREEMAAMINADNTKATTGSGAVVVTDSEHHFYSRRRRRSSVMTVMLFPPYYNHYDPYCYTWYGGGNHGGARYGYPIVRNHGYSRGGGYGVGHRGYGGGYNMHYHSGMGMNGMFMHQHGFGYMGGGLFTQSAFSGGYGGGFSGGGGGCDGESCLVMILAIIVFIVLIIVIMAIVAAVQATASAISAHCSQEENCHSWWYRGGRMRKKARKWAGMWDGIENNVYTTLGGYLIFDGKMDTSKEDRCMKDMQWGRRWAVKSDNTWMVLPSTEEAESGEVRKFVPDDAGVKN